MLEALRNQRPTLSPEQLQSALDVAYALRSTLEAEGHSHGDIVDGAEQVTNALIAQWVAEDMLPSNTQEAEFADEAARKRTLRQTMKRSRSRFISKSLEVELLPHASSHADQARNF